MAVQRNLIQLVLTLKDQLSRNAERMQGKMAKLQRRFKSIARGAREVGLGMAAMAASILVATKAAVSFADDIGKTARRIGLGAEALQEFRFAAEQAGVEVQIFDNAITALMRRAGEAIKGNKTFAKGFTDIGISIEELQRLKPEQLILRVADALSKIKDQNLKIAASDRIMSEAGRRVINVFDGGSEAMNRQREAARRLGIVLSDDLVEAAEKAADELNILTKILKVNLTRALIQAIKGFKRLFNIGEIQQTRSELEKIEKTIRDLAAIEAKGPAVSVTQQLERARQRSLELRMRLFELEDPGRPPPSSPPVSARLSATIQKQLEEKKQATIKTEEDIATALREINEEHNAFLEKEYIRNQELKRQIADKARREEKEARRRALDEEREDEEAAAHIIAKIKREQQREIEKSKQAMRDLGLTFQSAFEDAVISGKKFSDVLKSLALDIARLALRKAVIEPLFGVIGKVVGGFLGFQSGGEVPGPIGKPQLAVVHGGEKITPADGAAQKEIAQIITKIKRDQAGELQKIPNRIKDIGLQFQTMFEDAIMRTNKLPGFQFGGEVPGPIGRPQLAVVHGGERITPSGKSSNQTTVNLNANFQITSLDPTQAAAVIQKNMPVISRSLISEIGRGGRFAAAVGRKQAD